MGIDLASIIDYLIGLGLTVGFLFYVRNQPPEKKIGPFSLATFTKLVYAAILIFIMLIVVTLVTGKRV
jgi:hypothetical protein